MNEIIVLAGPSNCGKSSALNLVYSILLEEGQSTNKKKEGGDKKDFSDIVLWRGLRIAFYTMGDYSGAVTWAVDHYNAAKADVLVCACNDRFVRPFRVFEQRNAVVFRKVRETNSGLYGRVNRGIAEDIVNVLINISER